MERELPKVGRLYKTYVVNHVLWGGKDMYHNKVLFVEEKNPIEDSAIKYCSFENTGFYKACSGGSEKEIQEQFSRTCTFGEWCEQTMSPEEVEELKKSWKK